MCSIFTELDIYLAENGFIDDVYKSLEQEDKGDAVMTVLEIMKKTGKVPVIEHVSKQGEESRFLRTLADQCLGMDDYKNAFCLYNQAIRCAPNDSDPLFEAYFGRSKLFMAAQCKTSACIADIDRCLGWKNYKYQPKLKQMKADCLKITTAIPRSHPFGDNFFNIGETHPEVPSVSVAVDFVIANEQPKVVARRDIKTGTIVAIEKAYVGQLHEFHKTRACHYCHAFTLNLFPCDSCRYILFCSEKCKKSCMDEYHNVECHIIHVLEKIARDNLIYGLAVRAALKLKNVCTWKEFISASSNLGLKEMSSNLTNEVYDVFNKLSILRCNNNKHFVFGATYNAIFIYATIIHYLERVPSFFPRNAKKKDAAVRALTRILVHLFKAFGHIVATENISKNFNSEIITTVEGRNSGLFSFTSKLRHACDANLYVVGLNNKVALIALKPIKSGEELTIAVPGHWYEYQYYDRALSLFMISEILCRCPVCVEGWSQSNLKSANMTEKQKQTYVKWCQVKRAFFLRMVDISDMYKETCHCLDVLHNLPNTKEHKEIFDEFKRTLVSLQFRATHNFSVLVPGGNEIFVNYIPSSN